MAIGRLFVFISVFAALAAGCATQGYRDRAAQGLHPTISTSAYIEEGDLLALIVDTRVAALREDRDYVPFDVGIVNKGLEGLTVTLESFRLVDEDGRTYPAVRGAEVSKSYGSIDVDRRLAQLLPFMRGRFQSYQLIASRLTASFDQPLEGDEVFLPRFGMTNDLVYFPQPEGGVKDRVFSMLLTTDELENPIVIKFRVS